MMLCYNCTLEFFKVVIRPVTLSPDSIFSIFFFFFFFFFLFFSKVHSLVQLIMML